MKKIILTAAIVLAMGFSASAQYYGLLGRGNGILDLRDENTREGVLTTPGLPNDFGLDDDQGAPLGSGIVLIAGLGAAYIVGKRRSENEE